MKVWSKRICSFGARLSFDLDSLKKLQIPFLLLGPWGKDLHEGTERVHIDSVSRKLPHILDAIILTSAGNNHKSMGNSPDMTKNHEIV